MKASEPDFDSASVLDAISRARTVCPTWGSGWRVSIISAPDRQFRTALASVEQVLALASELQRIGFRPVMDLVHEEFAFQREASAAPPIADERSRTQ